MFEPRNELQKANPIPESARSFSCELRSKLIKGGRWGVMRGVGQVLVRILAVYKGLQGLLRGYFLV